MSMTERYAADLWRDREELARLREERIISRYDFEGGQYVRITASKEIDTEQALDMAETMITLKREELKRKKPSHFSTALDNDEREGFRAAGDSTLVDGR